MTPPIHTPPGTPPSPSASLYDVSDTEEEGEYKTIRQVRTGRGVKLLYTKSKVYVHPSPSAKDNIPGFVALFQQKPPQSALGSPHPASPSRPTNTPSSSLLLGWIPESSLRASEDYDTYVKLDLTDSSEPPKQSYLVPPPPTTRLSSSVGTYAFAVPVSEIYSLMVRPPSIGWWYGSAVINTRGGESFPALFFHDSECESTILQRKKRQKESFDPFGDGGGMFWGGDEVLRWLKMFVRVEKSEDPSIFLIDPSPEDKVSFGEKKLVKERKPDDSAIPDLPGSHKNARDGGMDPVTKVLKEARWNFLERLSQVTTFTRRTAQSLANDSRVPPQVRRLMHNAEVQTIQDEFDSARLYLARWAMGIAEQSEKEKRQRIWTAKDVLEMEESAVGDFEILDLDASGLSLKERRKPVTKSEWDAWFDLEGRLTVTPEEVKERVFHGGLDPDDGVRETAWLFLLGVYAWDSSDAERKVRLNDLREEYVKLKGSWWGRRFDKTSTGEDAEYWRDQKLRIEKDVHRTDRHIMIFHGEDIHPHPDPDSPFADVGTNVHLEQMKDMLLTYNEYNKTLGYVQGMSDLLSPIYAVMQDDAIAFWAFVGFMERMERNFLRDQSGMRLQLLTLDHLVQLMDPKLYLHLQSADSTNFFFFFRFLLVWYKREFDWDDVLRLWEGLWTDYMSSNFHLFVALAILEKHRDIIMTHLQHFDEVLKYVNELSQSIDLESTLIKAESLFRRFQRTVEAIDKKNHFPAPSLRQRKQPAGTSAAHDAAKVSGVTSSSSSRPNVTPLRRPGSSTVPVEGRDAEEDTALERVISPELRHLLSRTVDRMDRGQVVEHGGRVH